nr:AAA family ATPase [Pirellula staleyi]
MKGGQASKHLLYKHARKPGWFFSSNYGDVDSAWAAIRAGFVEAFTKAQAGDWDTIDDIAVLNGGQALRSKALYCYFPTELLPICSSTHIKRFVKAIQPELLEHSAGAIRLNRQLMKALRAKSCFQGWSNWELVAFLYQWNDPRESRQIVKIAPGEQAMYWDDCLKHGYICVGWDEVGDLKDFGTKEEFFSRFKEVYGERYTPAMLKQKANEVWILQELEAGDIIVANKGTSEVLAVGEVVDPCYEFRSDREVFTHTVNVKWNTSLATHIEPQRRWAFVTVAKCPVDLYQTIVGKNAKKLPIPIDPLYEEIAAALERKGQAILYGPPGTGKTYAARRLAVWWLLRKFGLPEAQETLSDPQKFAQAERSLSTVQVSQRVWWVTASPKTWSWERLRKEKTVEFHYGRLQRNYPLVQPGDLVIGYQSTPDKRIMALARISRGLSKSESGESSIELSYLHDVKNGLTYDELLADPILAKSEPMRFRSQGTLFSLEHDEVNHLLARLTDRDPDVADYLDVEGRVGQLTRLTFHGSYSYEDFIEGFRPVQSTGGLTLRLEDGVFKRICREAQANPDQPYLVLIDEFNRANVAKVFGELITLLELDKRGLIITLPQSKESFSIPPNVFVLGTMNTADRSIKLLDSAMRRRFAFIELMPDTELLRGGNIHGLELCEFLTELNRRIAEHAGREKQIGHSFLLEKGQPVSDAEEFARRFRQEILPLLQEYCYDDYEQLTRYLGNGLVDKTAQVLQEEKLADAEELVAVLLSEFTQASSAEL